jgi:hypothetical protein
VVEFLREPSIEQMQLKILGTQLEQGPKSIYDFKTITGEIDITATKLSK